MIEIEERTFRSAVYEEIGRNYRFFLNWRYAAFLGNFVTVGFVATSLAQLWSEVQHEVLAVFLLAGAIASLTFLLLDVRTARLFQLAYDAGAEMEGDVAGYFSYAGKKLAVTKQDRTRPLTLTHSKVIRFFYVCTLVLCIGFAAVLLLGYGG